MNLRSHVRAFARIHTVDRLSNSGKNNTCRPSRYIDALRFLMNILIAFHNRGAVHEKETSIIAVLLNSRSRWIMHLRHRNFTVQIYMKE